MRCRPALLLLVVLAIDGEIALVRALVVVQRLRFDDAYPCLTSCGVSLLTRNATTTATRTDNHIMPHPSACGLNRAHVAMIRGRGTAATSSMFHLL
eukprot:764906-Prorocentrum_minimum.AAC.1